MLKNSREGWEFVQIFRRAPQTTAYRYSRGDAVVAAAVVVVAATEGSAAEAIRAAKGAAAAVVETGVFRLFYVFGSGIFRDVIKSRAYIDHAYFSRTTEIKTPKKSSLCGLVQWACRRQAAGHSGISDPRAPPKLSSTADLVPRVPLGALQLWN